jgi:hypothetical protein
MDPSLICTPVHTLRLPAQPVKNKFNPKKSDPVATGRRNWSPVKAEGSSFFRGPPLPRLRSPEVNRPRHFDFHINFVLGACGTTP